MYPQVNPKQSFPALERETLAYWKANNTFKKSLAIREGAPEFNFYDGPPFATGTPHYGHLLAGTIKDVIPRYQTMQGKYVERRFGWDCHGLPIENIVEKKMNISGKKDIEEKIGVYEFNEGCRANVFGYTDVWRQTVERMGRWVDMDHDYKTMDTEFMESVWWVFAEIYRKGLIYESYRVVPYCPRCSTPLSNFEVNQGYEDKQDKAVTVKFKVKGSANKYVLAWTTTPWTLPANLGLAVGNDIVYVELSDKASGETYILAKDRIASYYKNPEDYTIVREYPGSCLVGIEYEPILPIISGIFDGTDENTCSIGVILRNEAGKYLFQGRTSDAPVSPNEIALFGGGLEEGEDVRDASVREIEEELDISLDRSKLRFIKYHPSVNFLGKSIAIFIYEDTVEVPRVLLEGKEILALESSEIYSNEKVTGFTKEVMQFFDGIKSGSNILGTRSYHIVPGHHVTTESGTGVVHIAPAFGEDDFQIGKKESLGFISHIDAIGHTTGLLSDNDVYVFDYNQIVIDRLKSEKKIIHIGTIDHSYPHCYRCHTPLIYRAISAWYVNVESIKDKMIANNEKITWVPDTIKHGRFGKWVEGARDWNISRNRYWGSALPVWKSEDGDIIVIGSVKELYEYNKSFGDIVEKDGKYMFKDGSDIDLHKHFVDKILLQKDGKTYTRIPEVLDCWFESGSMPYASKHYPFEGKNDFKFPADFIAEGLDQTRGWFYTLLILGTALFDNTPFLNVIVNGMILAEDGKKMSKSLSNYPDPMELMERHGADALRFYMLSSQVVKADDLRFSEAGVEEVVKKVLLPLWNTYSFFTTYANIDNFVPNTTEIYFMRHGQTDANLEKRLSDGLDNSPLNATGKAQAEEAGKQILANHAGTFDVIIASPLVRTRETAEIIAKTIGHKGEIIFDESFIERLGGKFSGMRFEDIEREMGIKIDYTKSGHMQVMHEGESLEDIYARVADGYQKLLQKYQGKRILIVSHGGVYRPLLRFAKGLSLEEAYAFKGIGNCEVVKLFTHPITNKLDVWIISRLNRLIAMVEGGFEAYDLQIPTRAITEFMDELTNWYIRRSRRRFWKSENDGDKLGAYETLYHVLVTLTQVMAPITPMISEAVYRGLTGAESIHLERFSEYSRTSIFPGLDTDMNRVREIITLGLALRGQKKIRVRQPFQSITIGEPLSEYFQEIICEELNVKEVKIEDMSHVARKICKPNAKLIGAKFGKAVQDIIREAKAGNFSELENGQIQINLPDKGGGEAGGFVILESAEYEIAYEPIEGVTLDVMSGSGMVVAMDTEITKELELEGYARDIVRVIQDLRKEAGYSVSDRIRVHLSGDSIDAILALFSDYITSETLSTIDSSLTSGDISKEIEIEGMMVNVVVKK